MNANLQQQTVFHLTGRRASETLEPVAGLGLRPALISRYRDLTRLRYDFPVVLVDGAGLQPFVRSLSEIVNVFLRANAAPGPDGEGMRKHVLRIESEIRRELASGKRDRLTMLWRRAALKLAAVLKESGLADSASAAYRLIAQGAVRVDGERVGDKDTTLPAGATYLLQAGKRGFARVTVKKSG